MWPPLVRGHLPNETKIIFPVKVLLWPITSRLNWPIRSITRVLYHQLTTYIHTYIQLTLTLKITTAEVVETSVTVINNSFIQHYVHPDDHTQPTYEVTPGFKPFTIIRTARKRPLLLSDRHHFLAWRSWTSFKWPRDAWGDPFVRCMCYAAQSLRRTFLDNLISYLSQRRNCVH